MHASFSFHTFTNLVKVTWYFVALFPTYYLRLLREIDGLIQVKQLENLLRQLFNRWCLLLLLGLPRWHGDKESACQCRKLGFCPWVGKIPWSSVQFSSFAQLCLTLQRHGLQHTRLPCLSPTPVFLPEESHGQRSLVGWAAEHTCTYCYYYQFPH